MVEVIDAGPLASARLLDPVALFLLQPRLTQPPGAHLAVNVLHR
ncbi:MAG TPA: hypothetical protein VFD32_09990 [Dehalococcoidia bacterium]|nr:hypothetical protein [Dehalococcoidia bacterium]